MRLHHMNFSRRGVRVDGVDLMVSADSPEPTIEPVASGLTIVTVGIVCENVVLDGDPHDDPTPTPIYDQLTKEIPGSEQE